VSLLDLKYLIFLYLVEHFVKCNDQFFLLGFCCALSSNPPITSTLMLLSFEKTLCYFLHISILRKFCVDYEHLSQMFYIRAQISILFKIISKTASGVVRYCANLSTCDTS
jgi:hypothetical protein